MSHLYLAYFLNALLTLKFSAIFSKTALIRTVVRKKVQKRIELMEVLIKTSFASKIKNQSGCTTQTKLIYQLIRQ